MSVIRIKKTENYVVIHKGVLEDPRLSFKAKGLWAYCMSRPDDWTFHVNHLATISKDGEDSVYSAIKELELHGYVKKVQAHVGGRFQKVDYEIFETSQIQIILPQREKQEAVKQEPVNPALLSIDSSLSIEEETKPRPSASPPSQAPESSFSLKSGYEEEAKDLTLELISSIRLTKPDFKSPSIDSWANEIEKMLRIDKRKVEICKKIIEWLPKAPTSSNGFSWSTNILCAASFRKQFDKLELEMRKTPSKTSSNDLELLKKLEDRVDLISRGIIVVGSDYVDFPKIRDAYFKVGTPEFYHGTINSLRKSNVPIK